MTDETENTRPSAPPSGPGRARPVAGGLALLLSLVTLIGLGYVWYILSYETHIVGVDVAKRLKAQGAALTQLDTRIAALGQAQAANSRAVRDLAQREASLASTHHPGRHWQIHAAADLLLIANDQLRFEHDVPLSLLALHQAQRALRRQDDPRLIPVREAILREILRLKALRRQHTSTMALELVALAHSARTLPLAVPRFMRAPRKAAAPTKSLPFWRRAAFGIWRDFRRLIRIRKEPVHERALLSPKRAYFVRENLALRLYGAQLALLEHRPALVGANLAAADRWIHRYFDVKARASQAVLVKLAALEHQTSTLTWPDISQSLHLLRRLSRAAS
ncbi:uroporphyrinogen-III C-methyltransferase [Acidiferrobacter sp.]|uniref:uroporphyrinogen-III C-methyltransferase n=1 Tax=Acidiferrobacter sp. TaxID=1872107 RepID=UPI00260EA6FF|nr:uroporphyrinogen-III C-methyltransferase [Acidiferrobacter sp.]